MVSLGLQRFPSRHVCVGVVGGGNTSMDCYLQIATGKQHHAGHVWASVNKQRGHNKGSSPAMRRDLRVEVSVLSWQEFHLYIAPPLPANSVRSGTERSGTAASRFKHTHTHLSAWPHLYTCSSAHTGGESRGQISPCCV